MRVPPKISILSLFYNDLLGWTRLSSIKLESASTNFTNFKGKRLLYPELDIS
jgi:hypothetical protein